MFKLGLTGGIASGKSTVVQFLREQGIPVCDSDVIARDVVAVGSVGLAQLVDAFGSTIVQADGRLDRQALATIIFQDAQARERVNQILHPLVFAAIDDWLAQQSETIVCIDMPLLYEVGYDTCVDAVVVVNVSEQTQLQRLMLRNGFDEQSALQRIQAQLPLKQKVQRATYVIDNNADINTTQLQVQALVSKLKTLYEGGSAYAVSTL